MPCYKDGTPAAEGDSVKGKPYSMPYEIVGVLTSIIPGAETCNCKVLFIDCITIEQVVSCLASFVSRNYAGSLKLYTLKEDYGQLNEFVKV